MAAGRTGFYDGAVPTSLPPFTSRNRSYRPGDCSWVASGGSIKGKRRWSFAQAPRPPDRL